MQNFNKRICIKKVSYKIFAENEDLLLFLKKNKDKLNKIAARWPAKAVAQFLLFKSSRHLPT